MHKRMFTMLLAAMMLLGALQSAQAALQSVGPVSPGTGYFPVWYQDTTRQLELCLSTTPSPDPAAAGAPMCTLLLDPGYDPALPIVFPNNFPSESFWFTADANIVNPVAGVDLRFVSSLEAAFSTGVVKNGDQISFTRIRFFVQLTTPGTYIITHPFGVDTFVVDRIDPIGREIQYTRDIGVADGIFTGALAGDIGPFLVRADALGNPSPIVIGNETFLGDPNVLQPVTGSRFGTNYVRIQGPGIDLQTNQFAVSGKVFGGTLPPALSFDRATYSRTANGSRVEVFATSNPAATLTFRETVAPGAETPLIGDGLTGRFLGQYNPAVLPASLVLQAVLAGSPPTLLSNPVTDLVKITKASYSLTTKELTIEAFSSDELPLPILTAVGWGTLSATPTGGVTQSLVVPNVDQPPGKITVKSSAGGSDTEPVVIPMFNIPPTAVNDIASTTNGVAVIINVLANDTDPNGNLPLAVSPASLTQPTSGTAVINADQTITYTPNAAFAGTDTFTYAAVDTLGALSNVATVTVTANDTPVANPDTATTRQDIAVVINVLANDINTVGTFDLASVTVTVPPTSGTTTDNATSGAITYTPNAGFVGTDTFSYTVADSLGAVSAAATVTITVNANVAPVAAADTAATIPGTPVVINVLANDTDADGTINAASLTVATAPLSGTAVVGAGTITYTSGAGFTGTDSFTYTVQDDSGAISNAATVTVTVAAAAPVANNDAAATAAGTSVVINVLANDLDLDGTLNPASVAIGTAPVSGTAVVDTVLGDVTYTPNPGFSGTDSFSYTVQDNLGLVSNVALVSIVVAGVNSAPIALDDTATTPMNTPVDIVVLANDSDLGGFLNPATVTLVTQPTSGTATISPAGVITCTPGVNFTGTYSFTYTVLDNLGAVSNVATVTVTVTPLANGIVVASPNGGESVAIGTTKAITWTYTGNPGSTITIELMRGNRRISRLARDIPIGTAGSGTYNWTVPGTQPIGADYRVRVFVSTNVGITDTSDAFFSIIPTGTIPTPAPGTETIAVSGTARVNARVRAAQRGGPQFTMRGTGAPGTTLSFYLGSDTTGQLIGAAVVSARGSWSFSRRVPEVALPITATSFSIRSSTGNTLLNRPLAVTQ